MQINKQSLRAKKADLKRSIEGKKESIREKDDKSSKYNQLTAQIEVMQKWLKWINNILNNQSQTGY